MSFLRFTPLYKERVWGSRRLAEVFARALPADGKPYGESWELVDRADDQSVVAEGKYAGLTLREICQKHGRELLKADFDPSRPFPILVKWLDCAERLSLQVHPPATIAPSLGGEPKTECWYIAEATPTAGVFAGLKKGVTRQAFEVSLKNNTLEPLIHRLPTQKGDSIFIPSGRLHAIDGGNLILEIQQNSDTTYRVYDWGRPREIHVEQSLLSTDFADFEPSLNPQGKGQNPFTFVKDRLFTLTRHTVEKGRSLNLPKLPSASILSIVEGSLEGAKPGDNLLIPYNESVTMAALTDCTVILTTNFL